MRGGLVACTGNAGCKFSASDTKGHAAALVDYLEARIAVDPPVNIHLTGCHHSCAQHYIADIGLLGAKVEHGEDMVEGYDLHVGGGAGADQAIGRLIRPRRAVGRAAADGARRCCGLDGAARRRRELPGLDRAPSRRRAWPRCVDRVRGRRGMNAISPPIPLIPENAPFSAGAARLAERLPRRPVRRRRCATPPCRSARRRRRKTSPGTTRRWSWTNGCAGRRPSRKRRLMAAMAQLDCGQCGYLCQTYAEALADGRETSTTLCVPGAKPTARKLKQLLAEAPGRRRGGSRRACARRRSPRACRCGCSRPTADRARARPRTCGMS